MSVTLWPVWERTVTDAPGATAIMDLTSGKTLSRRELSQEAEKLSGSLARAGGQVAAFAEPNGVGWFRSFLAIQRADAIALPLDASLPAAKRAEAAVAAGADLLLEADQVISLPATSRERARTGVNACLLKLTSGTTGSARPLPFTAAQMVADGEQVCAGMGIGPGDVNFGAIPCGHSYGLGNLVLPLLVQGTAVVCSTETLPGGWAEGIIRSGATVFPTVPAALRALAASAGVSPDRLGRLRLVISAGAFLRPDVARTFYGKFRTPPHNFYGSSETGGICFDADGEATLAGRSVGRPLPSVRVELDPAADGRVQVCSPAVMSPGHHRLADRARWNDHGELCLLGRAGTVANVGGRKVDPAGVEATLRALEGISDAWVGVRTRASGDDYLVAVVETSVNREEVLARMSACLPRWQVPRHTVTLPVLPRTTRGKLDRAELEARFR